MAIDQDLLEYMKLGVSALTPIVTGFVGIVILRLGKRMEINQQLHNELLRKRIASQPLSLPNAGSVFRNPPGDHAARLIEACGLKGLARGGARISEQHANFIVNPRGCASAADIEWLIAQARDTVRARTGVELHAEVRIVGEPA
jgi:UDP-N-acetylmuramate dehydrogenase